MTRTQPPVRPLKKDHRFLGHLLWVRLWRKDRYGKVQASVRVSANRPGRHSLRHPCCPQGFDLLTREKTVGGQVTIDEMKSLYATGMSASSGAARRYYDEIVNAAPNRICPLCGVGTVTTLDHHLPQSKYPDYVLVPANLVPSCSDCNKTKFTSSLGNLRTRRSTLISMITRAVHGSSRKSLKVLHRHSAFMRILRTNGLQLTATASKRHFDVFKLKHSSPQCWQ